MKSSKKLYLSEPSSAISAGRAPPTEAVPYTIVDYNKMRVYQSSRLKSRKKLSVLKKRILRERLQNHLQTKSIHNDVLADNISETQTSVGLFNFVDLVDIEDQDECEEIVQNVTEIMSTFGRIASIKIVEDSSREIISICEDVLRIKLDANLAAIRGGGKSRSNAKLKLDQANINDGDISYVATKDRLGSNAVGNFIVVTTFLDSSAAWRASHSVNGLVFGGTPVASVLFADGVIDKITGDLTPDKNNSDTNSDSIDQEGGNSHGDFLSTNDNDDDDDTGGATAVAGGGAGGGGSNDIRKLKNGRSSSQGDGKYIVRLENFVSVDDLEDQEEVDSILNDLVSVSSDFGALDSVWIQKFDHDLSQHRFDSNYCSNNINSCSSSANNAEATSIDHVNATIFEFPFQSSVSRQCISAGDFFPLSAIQCPSLALALQMATSLSGLIVSSNSLRVFVCSDDRNFTNLQSVVSSNYLGCDSISAPLVFNGIFYDLLQQQQQQQQLFALKLSNFVNLEQLEDPDEKEQILQDLDILRTTNSKSTDFSVLFGQADVHNRDSLDVIYIFQDFKDFVDVYKYYCGRIVGGIEIKPELLLVHSKNVSSLAAAHGTIRRVRNTSQNTEFFLKVYEDNDVGLSIYTANLPAHLSYSVVISGYISREDLQNANIGGNREEYIALKYDLLNLATSSLSSSVLNNSSNDDCITRVSILSGFGSEKNQSLQGNSKSAAAAITTTSSSSASSVAYLCFKQRKHAEAAYCNLDERSFGGVIALAFMEKETARDSNKNNSSSNSNSSIFAMKTLNDDDDNLVSKKFISVVVAQAYASEENSGFGGGGSVVDDSLGPKGSVPRQPKHSAPVYTIPVADDETNGFVIKMLNDLARFQKKLIETEPIKAKAKMRFAVGFKQVFNSVKSKRATLVLLAPDTETSGALDDKIGDLVEEAARNEIPVIYCLNRRKFAKSLDMSMRQSVVGVYKADGTFENFKKIITYIERNVGK